MRTETLILSVGKCSWGKCYACGWGRIQGKYTEEEAKEIIKKRNLSGVDKLKIFASGSLLDDNQFSPEFRKWLAEYLKEKGVKELVIESRPEFITPEALEPFKGLKLTVAIGLESANDEILKKYAKGFTVRDYLKAVKVLRDFGARIRTYVMVNIPFGTREDFDRTMEFALEHSDEVVAINTFPHSKAPLFDMWIRGEWSPLDKKQFKEWVEKWESNPKVEVDFQNYLFVPKFPPEKREKIVGATSQSLRHPHFEVWQDYFQRFYEPKPKKLLLFLPCSYRKPYPKSQTHQKIFQALKRTGHLRDIHRVVVSTPGVVPIEFSDYYPFNSYDWPEWEETPEIKEEYIKVTKERVKKFLEAHAHRYEKIACYFKHDSETYKAIQEAAEELGMSIPNLLGESAWEAVKDKKNPVAQREALASLTAGVKRLLEGQELGKET